MLFSQCTFVVTGGASGLGAATCAMLVATGAHVIVADQNDHVNECLAAGLGVAAQFVKTDATDEVSAAVVLISVMDFPFFVNFSELKILHNLCWLRLNRGVTGK